MKRFTAIFSVFLFLVLNVNTITTVAEPQRFSEGFYSPKDLNMMGNIKYSVQNVSPSYEAFMIIFDEKQRIQQAVRLEPNSQKHTLLVIGYNYKITIVGNGQLIFFT